MDAAGAEGRGVAAGTGATGEETAGAGLSSRRTVSTAASPGIGDARSFRAVALADAVRWAGLVRPAFCAAVSPISETDCFASEGTVGPGGGALTHWSSASGLVRLREPRGFGFGEGVGWTHFGCGPPFPRFAGEGAEVSGETGSGASSDRAEPLGEVFARPEAGAVAELASFAPGLAFPRIFCMRRSRSAMGEDLVPFSS